MAYAMCRRGSCGGACRAAHGDPPGHGLAGEEPGRGAGEAVACTPVATQGACVYIHTRGACSFYASRAPVPIVARLRSAGTLSREFKHLSLDIFLEAGKNGGKQLRVESHFGKRKNLASIRTCVSHVQNLITGVTKGYEYKMRLVYAHFPININIDNNGTKVEIRNFLGEKRVRVVNMLAGVSCERSSAVKDELVLTGNDIELVSRSAALIHQVRRRKEREVVLL